MKKIYTLLFAVQIALASQAQIGLRVYNYRPTGDFGYVMKPLTSAELSFTQAFDKKRVRPTFGISVLNFKPRMEIFPTYGLLTVGGNTTVLPGEQKFNKYLMVQLNGGIDVAVVKKEKFFAFLGAGISIGAIAVEYESRVQDIKDESYSGGGYFGGFKFRVGVEYKFNKHFSANISANRNVFLVSEPAALLWANDYGLGIIYTIK